jgi:hypothetical protein
MQDDSKSMPPGWWIVPGAVLGALSWAVIIRTAKRDSPLGNRALGRPSQTRAGKLPLA